MGGISADKRDWVRTMLGVNFAVASEPGSAGATGRRLSPADQAHYDDLLAAAAPAARALLAKGLAADHSLAELTGFAARIAGKDAAWLDDTLNLAGPATGSGAAQRWGEGSGVSPRDAVLAELDPLLALALRDAAPPPGRRPRAGLAGSLDQIAGTTGLRYDDRRIGTDASLEDCITVLANANGAPVPVMVGTRYVVVTGSDPGPPRSYTIHDPWSGETVARSERQFRAGALGLPGGGDRLDAFAAPTEVAP